MRWVDDWGPCNQSRRGGVNFNKQGTHTHARGGSRTDLSIFGLMWVSDGSPCQPTDRACVCLSKCRAQAHAHPFNQPTNRRQP